MSVKLVKTLPASQKSGLPLLQGLSNITASVLAITPLGHVHETSRMR